MNYVNANYDVIDDFIAINNFLEKTLSSMMCMTS